MLSKHSVRVVPLLLRSTFGIIMKPSFDPLVIFFTLGNTSLVGRPRTFRKKVGC